MAIRTTGEDLSAIKIKCVRCGNIFPPYLTPWTCPECGHKHPNLKRHYRTIGIYFVLGLIGSGIALLSLLGAAASANPTRLGLTVAFIEVGVVTLLLVIYARGVYRTMKPWESRGLKVTAWIVFAWAFVCKYVIPLLTGGYAKFQVLSLGNVIFLGFLIFWIWLNVVTASCTAREPSVE